MTSNSDDDMSALMNRKGYLQRIVCEMIQNVSSVDSKAN